MRRYDKELLESMERRAWCSIENDVEYEIRPIPEEEKTAGMDPRMLEAAKAKAKRLQTTFSAETFQLFEERYRPDKVNYDLTKGKICKRQFLVPVEDHFINTFFYWPEEKTENLPVIIYVHGGAFMTGDHRQFDNQCRFLAQNAKACIVFPEYRLAPENPFPAGLQDVEKVIAWVYKELYFVSIDQKRIVLAGDSAGASIINGCALGPSKDYIRLLFEIYPLCDVDIIGNGIYSWNQDYYSIPDSEAEYILSRMNRLKNGCRGMSLFYAKNQYGTDPRISIVYQDDFSSFPETVVAIGEFDFLRVSADIFTQKLKDAGKLKKAVRYQGCDHGFFDMFGIMPQAEDIARLLVDEVKKL